MHERRLRQNRTRLQRRHPIWIVQGDERACLLRHPVGGGEDSRRQFRPSRRRTVDENGTVRSWRHLRVGELRAYRPDVHQYSQALRSVAAHIRCGCFEPFLVPSPLLPCLQNWWGRFKQMRTTPIPTPFRRTRAESLPQRIFLLYPRKNKKFNAFERSITCFSSVVNRLEFRRIERPLLHGNGHHPAGMDSHFGKPLRPLLTENQSPSFYQLPNAAPNAAIM